MRPAALRADFPPTKVVGRDVDHHVETRYAAASAASKYVAHVQGEILARGPVDLERAGGDRHLVEASREIRAPGEGVRTSAAARLKVLCPGCS